MYKKHSGIYTFYIGFVDIFMLILAWACAIFLRFHVPLLPSVDVIPDYAQYAFLITLIAPAWFISFKISGAYEPMRGKNLYYETVILLSGITLMTVLLTSFTFFYRDYSYSRLTILLFWALSIFFVVGGRFVVRKYLAGQRRKGYFMKNVLIIGTGPLAKALEEKIHLHPEMGLDIKGFVTSKQDDDEDEGEVIGHINEIDQLIKKYAIEQIFVAVDLKHYHQLDELFENLHDETIDIKVVPDFMKFMRLNPGIDDLDGIPIVNLLETPLIGWNLIVKRIFDVVFSSVFLLIASPLMLFVALLVKFTAPGPILYRQERMGLDGSHFNMYKFRTMRVDAEKETGAVWASANDDRRTPIGAFLRSSSLDELPQFVNILKGEMSLVGPRPERPHFVGQFKQSIPLYMLRHRMKAGLTGWAQVNGLRGNTSLEKRIEYDLYYIENWSLAFDLKIIFLTFFKGFVNKNAY